MLVEESLLAFILLAAPHLNNHGTLNWEQEKSYRCRERLHQQTVSRDAESEQVQNAIHDVTQCPVTHHTMSIPFALMSFREERNYILDLRT